MGALITCAFFPLASYRAVDSPGEHACESSLKTDCKGSLTESRNIRILPIFIWSGSVELGEPGFGYPQVDVGKMHGKCNGTRKNRG
jgi:hypothetical protein